VTTSAMRSRTLLYGLGLFLCLSPGLAEEAAAEGGAPAEKEQDETESLLKKMKSAMVSAEGGAPAEEKWEEVGGEQDETKLLLKQLIIAMVSEVIDETTIEIRDSGKGEQRRTDKIHIKLGNIRPVRQGAAHSDEQHAEKRAAAKQALTDLVGKKMIRWKAGPEEHQPPAPAEGSKVPQVIVGDMWMLNGRHVNSLMAKAGHVDRETVYTDELARNILQAESEEKKQESYKELERAMKESAKEKKKQYAAELEKEKDIPEPIGMAGWLGLGFLGLIVLAGLSNFGRGSNKKVNLNKKRGVFEKFWMKLKGA